MKLSIIILTKNSEETIADCVESLKDFGEEILVVDSKSTDRTTDIAERFGARVLVHQFENFASQRDFAMQKAVCDWVLYIDSDEEVTSEFKNEVGKILESHENLNGYYIQRKTFYYGKDWGLTDKVQRLFFKPRFVEWYGVVHETPKIKGEFGIVNSPIFHYTHRNLSQMVEKTNKWSEFEAELRFKSGHPKMSAWRFFRVMATAFFRSYFLQNGYKNGTEGMIEAMYQSFSMFITYAKLWEKQQKIKG